MREALAKKWKYKIPGEIVKIEEVEIPQEKVKVPDSVEKTAKKLIKKYDKIGGETKFKNIVDANKKKKKWFHKQNKKFFRQKKCTDNS